MILRYLCMMILAFAPLFCFSNISDLPTQRIGNTEFFVYSVGNKENIYSVCKKLGIKKEDVIKYNPTVADGMKKGQKLFFPVNDFSDADVENSIVPPTHFTHTVEKGESIYGISKMYNIPVETIIASNKHVARGVNEGDVLNIPQTALELLTLDDKTFSPNSIIYHTIRKGDTAYNVADRYSTTIERIMELNPGISPSNFKVDDVIKVEPNKVAEKSHKETEAKFYAYRVNKNESLYSIARKHDVSVEQLMEANPDIKSIKKGMFIYIPQINGDAIVLDSLSMVKKTEEIYDSINATDKSSLTIALILPFHLNSKDETKVGKLYTEFYKGFLIAVDSIATNSGKEINICAFDSYNSTDSVRSILSRPELKSADLIFAPEEMQQLELVSCFGKENGVKVINSFIIKSDSYVENPELIQMNIPHEFMYSKVVDEVNTRFCDSRIVFLGMSDDEKNDKDLVGELKRHSNLQSSTFRFDTNLTVENLDSIFLQGKKVLFVPTNSNKKTLSKISIALKRYKIEHPECDFAVLGYPEWITYQFDYKPTFHEIDTYIYSRFYVNEDDEEYQIFERNFKKWYGETMINAAPIFGVLGFDSGMFFLKQMIADGRNFDSEIDEYHGIQNDFDIERISNWGGFINKALYFIRYNIDGTVEKIRR